jgi:chromosomal replication initiator protein
MARNAFEIDPSQFPELWKAALQVIQQRVTPEQVKAWISSLRFLGAQSDPQSDPGAWSIRLAASTEWQKNWVAEHHEKVISEAFTQILGAPARLSLEVSPTDGSEPAPSQDFSQTPLGSLEASGEPLPPMAAEAFPSAPSSPQIDPTHTFDTYVVGASNQFAHASAIAVAEKPAQEYNPLFLYSPPGLGKTHLLHAIANHFKSRNPQAKIAYLSAEQFVNEMVEALKTQQMTRFRNKYRNSFDMILIDDIQFLAGKERSEEEFFHTFNALHSSKRQIVVTSDRPPKEIERLEERVKTRFLCGLVSDIQAPEIETRIAILKQKAERDDVYLPDEVATFLATHIKSNVRELEGTLIKLKAQASLTGAEISLDMAQKELRISDEQITPALTVETIQAAVARHYQLKIHDLKGASRARSVARPRQIAIYLTRKYTELGLKEIGAHFGGRDHSTVLHACETIETGLEADPSIREAVEGIQNLL